MILLLRGGTLWDNRTLYSLYVEAQTPWEWHEPIKDYVESRGVEFLSSPFDKRDVYKRQALLHEHHGGWYYEMQELGYNYRLTDFQAALGISQRCV